MCRSLGSAKITAVTASAWSASRGTTPSGRMSSAAPTHAMTTAAPKTATSGVAGETARLNRPNAVAAMVAAMTAMPPPCGVGVRCDDRAFGFASA